MKKFLIKTLAIGSLALLIILLLLVFVPKDEDSYLMAYNKKCHLLDSIPSPRIIFVGGSNLCFGLDSRRIQDSLQMNVINYGLHAGIGLKFMIDDIEAYMGEGDVVVIAPEYQQFYDCMYGEAMTISPLMACSKWEKISMLNGRQMMQVLQGVPYVVRENVRNILPKTKSPDYVYRLSGINEYGDETNHWSLPNRQIPPTKPIKKRFDEDFARYFIAKVESLEQKGSVLIIPPVIRSNSYQVFRKQAEQVNLFLQENNHPFYVPTIHHVLPDSCAYDTMYHMNKDGVDVFTSYVIEELKKFLQGDRK